MRVPQTLIKPLKILAVIGSLLAAYGLIGFLLLPAVIRWQLPVLVERQTGRKAEIEKVDFNPFLLKAALVGFRMAEKQSGVFAAFEKFAVDIDAVESIARGAVKIDEIVLQKPYLRVARDKNGRFNFNDLLKAEQAPEKPQDSSLFPVIVGRLALSGGRIDWRDEVPSQPVSEEVYPVNFVLENFATQPDQEAKLEFGLALKSGGTLNWQGSVGINPVISSGRLTLAALDVKRLFALIGRAAFDLQGNQMIEVKYDVRYQNKKLELAVTDSKIALEKFRYTGSTDKPLSLQMRHLLVQGAYRLSYQDNVLKFEANRSRAEIQELEMSGLGSARAKAPNVVLESDCRVEYAGKKTVIRADAGQLTVAEAALYGDKPNEAVVRVPSLTIKGIHLNLNERQLAVDAATLNRAFAKIVLNRDGTVNLQTLLARPKSQTAAGSAAPKPTPEKSAPWTVKAGNMALLEGRLDFTDALNGDGPVNYKIQPINLKLPSVSTIRDAKLPFQFDAVIDGGGAVGIRGQAVLQPLTVEAAVDVDKIELNKFQPYLEPYARLDIIDGKLSVHGDAALAPNAGGPPALAFKGRAGIAYLLTRDRKVQRDLVKWQNLTVDGIDLDLAASRFAAAALTLEKPYARVIIRKDRTLNFSEIPVSRAASGRGSAGRGSAGTQSGAKPAERLFQLHKFKLVDGSSDFADLSLILPFSAHIESLNGDARGLSSERDSKMKIELQGKAYDLAPVNIRGEISPRLSNFNVEMNFRGMPMPLMSPYMAQFAGYKVEKGKLTLNLKYAVKDKKLQASNSILIDQFELGEKVENPNAVSLPMELAVALLKDSEGKIKIDVPIAGSLENPQFSIGSLIADALVNVLTKIVTSPFRAIASLMGTDKDLSVIGFEAGQAKLSTQAAEKLDNIAKALTAKPALNIEIKGAAYQEQDWPALQKAALYDQLKEIKADEISREKKRKTRAEYVELSEDDYRRLLAERFLQKFPNLAEKSLFGTPRLKDESLGDFYKVAEDRLSATIKPNEFRLKNLAAARAQAIAAYLAEKGHIADGRIYILDTALDPKRSNTDIASFLSLSAS